MQLYENFTAYLTGKTDKIYVSPQAESNVHLKRSMERIFRSCVSERANPDRDSGLPDVYFKPKSEIDVILVSGGLDSFLMSKVCQALHPDSEKIFLHIDLKTQYSNIEKKLAEKLYGKESLAIEEHDIHKRPEWNHIIPARNLFLVQRALSYIPPESKGRIWMAILAGELRREGDKSPDFIVGLNSYFQATNRLVKLETMASATKNEWLKEFTKTATPEQIQEAVGSTISCYGELKTDSVKGCGQCQACFRKLVALKYSDIPHKEYFIKDPERFAIDHGKRYLEAMTTAIANDDYSSYNRRRVESDYDIISKIVHKK